MDVLRAHRDARAHQHRAALPRVREDNSITVALNLGDDAIDYPAQGSEVLAGEAHLNDGRVSVPPHGWAVIG